MPTISSAIPPETSYPSRTCLTWTPDGELASDDHHDILARLAAVDPLGDLLCSCDLGAAAVAPIPRVT